MTAEAAPEAIREYTQDVVGQDAVIYCAGRVTLLEVLQILAEKDKTLKSPEARYKQGTLLIISDCCFSGSWAREMAWCTSEHRGLSGQVGGKDPEGKYEWMDRVLHPVVLGERGGGLRRRVQPVVLERPAGHRRSQGREDRAGVGGEEPG